jgi:hypothetical protein
MGDVVCRRRRWGGAVWGTSMASAWKIYSWEESGNRCPEDKGAEAIPVDPPSPRGQQVADDVARRRRRCWRWCRRRLTSGNTRAECPVGDCVTRTVLTYVGQGLRVGGSGRKPYASGRRKSGLPEGPHAFPAPGVVALCPHLSPRIYARRLRIESARISGPGTFEKLADADRAIPSSHVSLAAFWIRKGGREGGGRGMGKGRLINFYLGGKSNVIKRALRAGRFSWIHVMA